MATRKILSILLLALLINPALHCMDETDDEAMSTTKYVLGGLGLAGVVVLSSVLGANKLINHRKQELLCGAQNIEVFTSKRLEGPFNVVERVGKKIGIHGIFKNSNNTKINQLYDQVTIRLLPSWSVRLFGKNEYNLDDEAKISKLFLEYMQAMNLNGIVALMTPCCGRDKKRKTLVVSSGGSYSAFCLINASCLIVDRDVYYVEQGKYFILKKKTNCSFAEKIEEKKFKYTDVGSGHIVLSTKNVSQESLEKVRRKNNEAIIDAVFSTSNDNGEKEDKAILLIPVHDLSYAE